MNIPERWAYLAVFIAVLGHAPSEFFAVLTGVFGPEVSVWRFTVGGGGLVLWALLDPRSRDLITPLRDGGLRLVGLTMLGVTFPYLAFHWSLDYASVIQIATFITTMPIWVGLTNLWINKQPFTLVKVVTAAMALAGIVLLLTDGALELLEGDVNSLIGIGLVSVCAALGSGYAVMIKPLVNRHGALRNHRGDDDDGRGRPLAHGRCGLRRLGRSDLAVRPRTLRGEPRNQPRLVAAGAGPLKHRHHTAAVVWRPCRGAGHDPGDLPRFIHEGGWVSGFRVGSPGVAGCG